MKTTKGLRVKTEAAAYVVIRDGKGKKLFEINLPGVSITVAVSADANIQVDGAKNGK